MPNMLMIHHAATRTNGDEMARKNAMPMDNYNTMPMGISAMPFMPMQHPVHDEYEGGAESRYRGKDGSWRARKRNMEMTGRKYETRAGDDDEEEEEEGRQYKIEVLPQNVIEWPYGDRQNDERRNGRQIGFGARNAMGNGEHMTENHNGMHDMHEYDGGESEGFSRYTAEKWVKDMEPEDRQQPKGGKWTPEMIRPIAQKYGISPDSDRFWEFYAVMNAIYSDTSMIAREYGITTADYYAKLAKAWLEDRDAVPNKADMYYRYIVKHH